MFTTVYYRFFGFLPEQEFEYLKNFKNILFVSGKFGTGKSTMIRELIKTGKYIFMPKHTPRSPRKEEREGLIPFKEFNLKDIYCTDEPIFSCINIDLNTSNFWEDLVRKLDFKISLPDFIELVTHIGEFISVYLFNEIIESCRKAEEQNKIILLEITPEHEEDWREVFPKARIVRLNTIQSLRINRLIKRYEEDPQIDQGGVIKGAKILYSCYLDQKISSFPILNLKSNFTDDLNQNLEKVRRYCEV